MSFFEDFFFMLDLAKWFLMLYMAYWLYTWARDKLVFAPTIGLIVAGILIYFLVIEHPFIGALGIFGWMMITGGLMYVIGTFAPGLYMFMHRR
jgi:hypothetical protein